MMGRKRAYATLGAFGAAGLITVLLLLAREPRERASSKRAGGGSKEPAAAAAPAPEARKINERQGADPNYPPGVQPLPEPPGNARAEALEPIEEILAREGEDPGAVFYTSRIREAIEEGNPAFARELLRQLKLRHPGSVLADEAEVLMEEAR